MMEVIFIVSLILGVAENLWASGTKDIISEKLSKAWKPVINKMQKDNQLIAELEKAYAEKNTSLMNSIMTASPFASDFAKMRSQLKEIKQKSGQLSKDKIQLAEDQANVTAKYNKLANTSPSGSIIGDLINFGWQGNNFNPEQDLKYDGLDQTNVEKELKEIYKV